MTATKKSTKKEVATTAAKDIATTGFDYGADEGAGFENTRQEDLSIPFLGVLQTNSPQVDEDDGIEGAKAGMLFNSVTKELMDGGKGLVIVPAHKEMVMVEWIDRDGGGGYVGRHKMNSDFVKKAIANNNDDKFGKIPCGEVDGKKHDLVETHYVYVLILDNGGKNAIGFALIAFTSTKLTPCRDWYTSMYMLKVGGKKPPMFAHRARIKTVKQKNAQGSFYNFSIEPLNSDWLSSLIDPQNEAPLLVEARNLKEMVESGERKADFNAQNDTSGKGGKGGEGNLDDDAPF